MRDSTRLHKLGRMQRTGREGKSATDPNRRYVKFKVEGKSENLELG